MSKKEFLENIVLIVIIGYWYLNIVIINDKEMNKKI